MASVLPRHKYILCEGLESKRPLYIIIDGFNYASKLSDAFVEKNDVLYFLSHAHSDHYQGLKASWTSTIFCSEITGNVIEHLLDIQDKYIRRLPLGLEVEVPFNVKVTLVCANHCPGAVMMLFDLPTGNKVIHCGDFRYDRDRMSTCPHLRRFKNCCSMYLDTTYCNPRHQFPPQHESIDYIARTVQEEIQKDIDKGVVGGKRKSQTISNQYDVLYLISTYVIGKERILEEIHRRTGKPIYVHERKAGILESVRLDTSMFTQSSDKTPIHVVKWNFLGETWPYFRPNYVDAARYAEDVGATRVIGFVPTGWVHNAKQAGNKVLSKNNVTIHLVPYSEHSSFDELLEFVGMIRPSRVIPTVNAMDEKQVAKQLKYFSNLVNINASKLSFISKFAKSTSSQQKLDAKVREEDGTEEQEDMVVVLEERGNESLTHQAGTSHRNQDTIVDISQDYRTDEESQVLALQEICGSSNRKYMETLIKQSGGDVGKAAARYFDAMENKMIANKSPSSKSHQKSILSYFDRSPGSKKKAEKDVYETLIPQSSPLDVDVDECLIRENTPIDLHERFEHDVSTSILIKGIPQDSVALSLEKYRPKDDAMWMQPHQTPYAHIARAFETMESTTKRTKISICLTNTLRSILAISPHDLKNACYLLLGRLAPDYHSIELNIGSSTVCTAMTEALGISRSKIREMHKVQGDLGSIAFRCKKAQTMLRAPAHLTVQSVYDTMMSIATDSGQGSHGRKKTKIVRMLRSSSSAVETKFLVRTLVKNLRVGANWRSVMPALGKAILLHTRLEFPTKEELDHAAASSVDMYHIVPNIETLIDIMLEYDMCEWTSKVSLAPGVPIKPMLAKISEGVSDALDQISMDGVLVEYKYDGMRAQIHIKKDGFDETESTSNQLKIFSRNSEDRTLSFLDLIPDILAALGDHVTQAIFDSEICAISKDSDGKFRIRSFQDLSSRPKHLSASTSSDIDICAFMFDCLQLNGESLLGKPLCVRRQIMEDSLQNRKDGKVELAKGSIFARSEGDLRTHLTTDKLQGLLEDALENKAEGVMIKALDSPYDPNKRSNKWIKLKRDYCSDLSDTIDVCVIGAWHGNGRKAGWYSPFLMAVYDEGTQTFQSLCRVMSGFSDEFYKNTTERLSKTVLESKPFDVMTGENPAVWFGTREVWEIRGAELQISPVHASAMGQVHEGKGLGLRFPRFLRTRDDKSPEDATTSDDIVAMYMKQNK